MNAEMNKSNWWVLNVPGVDSFLAKTIDIQIIRSANENSVYRCEIGFWDAIDLDSFAQLGVNFLLKFLNKKGEVSRKVLMENLKSIEIRENLGYNTSELATIRVIAVFSGFKTGMNVDDEPCQPSDSEQ